MVDTLIRRTLQFWQPPRDLAWVFRLRTRNPDDISAGNLGAGRRSDKAGRYARICLW